MSFLFGRSKPPAARFPDNRVGYAIGDIHGRVDLLGDLLDKLEAQAAADTRAGPPIAIFLGDYVDRGPNSHDVIELLLTGRPHGFERRFLKGNHEAGMLSFLEAPLQNRAWVIHGGYETLVSYGVPAPSSVGAPDQAWVDAGEAFKARVPEAHLAFLNALERYIVLGDYAFVHAGVDFTRPLDKQTDADLFWSRTRFLASKKNYDYRIVHGHTPTDQPFADHRRIGVDTGAYASGTLTAVRLENEEATFVSVSGARKAPDRAQHFE